jgi:anaerobic ribonucleoside-triphosphate reductase activating protein
MRYNKIRKLDISNGDGCGVTIFTQGCPIHCQGCFNQDLWDENGGKEWTSETFKLVEELLANPYIDHLTWLGGEPTIYAEAIADINRHLKDKFPNLVIWLYSGYTYHHLTSKLNTKDLLTTIDILVDGPFVQDLQDINLKFRGSSNQNIIHLTNRINKELW